MSKTWNTTEQISTKSWRMWLFCCLFSFGKNEMFRLQYSRTSKQRPPWRQKKVANVETWPLSGGRVVTWQKFKGVQQVYCAKFMLIVSHNGNPIINNGRKTVPAFVTCSQWLNCGGNRGEIVRQHVKAHSCSHFSPCFDHTSPTQTDDGTSQIDHEIGAYVPYSFRTMSRVLLRPLPTEVQGWRRQGQRLNDTAQWRDHLNWERSFTASMISPVF